MKYLTLLILIFTVNQLCAQIIPESQLITLNGRKYLRPSLATTRTILEISTEDWETAMQELGYSDKGFEHGCPYFSSGADLKGKIISIGKCPNLMNWSWSNFDGKEDITKELMASLEPYYSERDDEALVYRFKTDSELVTFRVIRKSAGKGIIVIIVAGKRKLHP